MVSVSFQCQRLGVNINSGALIRGFVGMDELFHFLNRICCIQNGAADGYTINTDRHDVGNIGQRDSANGTQGNCDCFVTHGFHDFLVASQSQNRRKVFLGLCLTERAATDVIGRSTVNPPDVFNGVCRSANQKSFAEEAAGFIHWHIVFP